jgi:S-adenosylmethionine:tRNA ribosyltransferase-isomerase
MKLSQYDFSLPASLIAKMPLNNRDDSKLLVLHRKTQKLEHKTFKDLLNYFDEGDVMVFNNTKVAPVRLFGNKEKTGARIELLLMRELSEENFLWDVLVDPARKIRVGNKVYFGNDELIGEVIDNTTSRGRTLRFLYDGSHLKLQKLLQKLGEPPIPKYLKRANVPEDIERYQTVFAKHEGAVIPPYAGFHFSREILKRLEIKGVNLTELTLHLGIGSSKNIGVEDLSKHKPSAEQLIVSAETAKIVNDAKLAQKRVCAVGTSVFRALEDRGTTEGTVITSETWISKFLFPPYKPLVPTHLITNFHLPRSMMMMVVTAFTGYDLLKEVYRKAIKERYRFGCYGDAMLIMD